MCTSKFLKAKVPNEWFFPIVSERRIVADLWQWSPLHDPSEARYTMTEDATPEWTNPTYQNSGKNISNIFVSERYFHLGGGGANLGQKAILFLRFTVSVKR